MTDSTKTTAASDARDALPPASTSDALTGPRAALAKVIPRRPRVSWWLGILLAVGFALLVIPSITADRWLGVNAKVERGVPAPFTVRVPPFAGIDSTMGHIGGGAVLIARGEVPDRDTVETAQQIEAGLPHGAVPFFAYLVLVGVLAGLFAHHTRRSTHGRLLRVQLVSFATIVVTAILVKIAMLTTAASILVVPVALFAMVPTLVLDRIVGLATGTLAALVMSLLVPFDVGVAVMLMVQAGAAGLVIAERPKRRLRPTLMAGLAATLFTAATYPLMLYLTTGRLPLAELDDPVRSLWLASALGPAIATLLAIPMVPLYQLLVGEITQSKLVELEDLSNPLLKQIASKAPGTWQHSLMMANMAEIAANAIGANGRLVRVGAYYHDLGKSLQPKYFIENLEPGETSPHDKLPPEVSCDAIFAHVTEGIVAARRAGLHERIIDFMHMHHGNGVLEYFWGKTREQGNPKGLTVEHFRYPGVPPHSRETAILSICDAVEAASRTLKKPEVSAIDNLVQRIVYGKLHLGQLDESGLSMSDLRRIAESLRETIRHANHGRIEYPWQKAQQDASAPPPAALTQTGPRLDSLDRPARPDTMAAATTGPKPNESSDLALVATAPITPSGEAATVKYAKEDIDEVVELRATKPKLDEDAEIVVSASQLLSAEPVRHGDKAEAPRTTLVGAPEGRVPFAAHESDPRMRRATNPVAEERRDSQEVIQFANDAKDALDEASRDMAGLPRDAADRVPAARKRAATLPPIKPPTVPPPIGRRSPTMQPFPAVRPPNAPGGMTVPPPDALRPPGPNLLDDMITLRPQYEPASDIRIKRDDDGSVTIMPSKSSDDAVVTQPRMLVPDAGESADFGRATPVSAPTRAELQALLDSPPDVTRQQSLVELEELQRQTRPSDQELPATRRTPYPTREVDDADIEAAIELAPPARRNALGVAKKPKE